MQNLKFTFSDFFFLLRNFQNGCFGQSASKEGSEVPSAVYATLPAACWGTLPPASCKIPKTQLFSRIQLVEGTTKMSGSSGHLASESCLLSTKQHAFVFLRVLFGPSSLQERNKTKRNSKISKFEILHNVTI